MTITLEAPERHALLSNSQRASLLRCPNQFRLERGGFPVAPSLALIAGSAYHSASDTIDWMLWEGHEVTLADVQKAWTDAFNVECADAMEREPDDSKWKVYGRRTKDKPNKEDRAWWRDNGHAFLLGYLEHRKVEMSAGTDIWELPDGSPAIEVHFQFEIAPGVTLRGAIDRIMRGGDALLIRDLKTSQREPIDVSQLGIYRVAVKETFGVEVWWGDYYMARLGSSTTPVDLRHFTPGLLAREYGFIADMKALSIYPANPGDNCRSCQVKAGCAAVGGTEADTWLKVFPK